MTRREVVATIISVGLAQKVDEDFLLRVTLEPDGEDAFTYDLPVTESGRAWINNLLDALGVQRRDFWGEKLTLDGDRVASIGAWSFAPSRVRVAFSGDARPRYVFE